MASNSASSAASLARALCSSPVAILTREPPRLSRSRHKDSRLLADSLCLIGHMAQHASSGARIPDRDPYKHNDCACIENGTSSIDCRQGFGVHEEIIPAGGPAR